MIKKILYSGYIGEVNPYGFLIKNSLEKHGVQLVECKSGGWLPILSSYNKCRCKVLHLNWLYPYWLSKYKIKSVVKSLQFWMELITLKLFGVKIVWTVHNLYNHESKQLWLDKANNYIVSHLSDKLSVFCEESIQIVSREYQIKPEKIVSVRHGSYFGYYKDSSSDLNLFKSTNTKNDFVFLFFGNIRSYKGVTSLVKCVQKITKKNWKLIIVGKCDPEMETWFEHNSYDTQRIILVNKFISKKELSRYFAASDVVVLPFKQVLNTGSLWLALTMGKPIITSNKVCGFEKNDGVFRFNNEQDLVRLLNKVVSMKLQDLKKIGLQNKRYAYENRSDEVVADYIKLYENL